MQGPRSQADADVWLCCVAAGGVGWPLGAERKAGRPLPLCTPGPLGAAPMDRAPQTLGWVVPRRDTGQAAGEEEGEGTAAQGLDMLS